MTSVKLKWIDDYYFDDITGKMLGRISFIEGQGWALEDYYLKVDSKPHPNKNDMKGFIRELYNGT